MELVAFLGNDEENWGQVAAIVKRTEADKIVIVKNNGGHSIPLPEKAEEIVVDSDRPLMALKQEIISKLKPKVSGELEVCLSIASGSGKEHMALISALLGIPVGIRFVAYTKEGIQYVN